MARSRDLDYFCILVLLLLHQLNEIDCLINAR